MRFLRTNTATRLTVGPFFDKTDGVTPETALTVTSCKLTLMVDDGNVPTLVLDTAPTASGGANDMVHVTGDDAGFYDLELAAGNVNYLGRAMLAITDAATHCPVFHEFMILPAMIYDSLVLGTDRLDTNVTHAADVAWASGAITAAVIATDAIDADAIADNAINAAAIAADAITAAKLASDVTTEIQNGLATASALDAVDNFIDTEVAAIKTVVDGIQTDLDNGTDGLGALKTLIDTLDNFVDTEMAAVLAAVDTEVAAIKAKTDLIPAAPAAVGDIPTAAAVADAVWDEAIAGHAGAGSTGEALGAAGSAGDPWTTALPGAYGAGSAGKIIGDNINATISSRASQTSVDDVPTNAELATALGTADDAVLASIATLQTYVDTEVAAILAAVDTEVAAIKAKTDNLPASPANEATLTTIATYIDTEVASILAAVDTEVAAIKAKTDNLPTDPADASDIAASFASIASTLSTLSAYVDTEVAAIKAKTDSLTFTVAGVVDSNIQRVNDVAVAGTGASGDEWGPV